MEKWSSNGKLSSRFLSRLLLLLFFLPATGALAEWQFESLSHDPAIAGQPLKIVVRLSGSGGNAIHVSASVAQDPSFQEVAETREISASLRETEFTLPLKADATGYWHFVFQVVEDGTGKARKELWVQIHETYPATAPAATPAVAVTPAQPIVSATSPVVTSPPVFVVPTQPAMPTPEPTPVITPTPSILPTQPTTSAASQPTDFDLAVEFVEAPPEIAGAPGETRILHYKVRNLGTQPSPVTLIRYGSNLQGGFDRYEKPLPPGQEINGAVNFEIDIDMNECWIEVSSRDNVDQSPSNNRDARTVKVGPPSPYNLTLSDLQLVTPLESVRPGDPIEVRFILTNQGPANIDKPFVVSLEGLEGGALFQTVNYAIAPSTSKYIIFRGWLPSGSAGDLILKASADVTNVLTESNEADNSASLDLGAQPPVPPSPTTTPPVSPDQQDMAILSLNVSPQRPEPGAPVLFVITTNMKTVSDLTGNQYEVERFLSLDPRGDRSAPIQFTYNSSIADSRRGSVYLFVATYAYGRQDSGLERRAQITYQPPENIPDADPANNAATGIVQIQ